MKLLKSIFLVIFIFNLTLYAQTEEQKQEMLQLAREKSTEWQNQRKQAEQIAKDLDMPIRSTTPDGRTYELEGYLDGTFLYMTTNNVDAAKTISTDKLWPGGSTGFDLTGNGQTLGEWDAGKVRETHQELVGRVTQVDNSPNWHNHATHVAGTMIAAGVEAKAKGMSYEAVLDAYDWNNDESEMLSAAANGLRVSNHSYGIITGWYYNFFGDGRWAWFGHRGIDEEEDFYFGAYTNTTKGWDEVAYNSPNYLICVAAGNDRNDAPGNQPVTHWSYNPNTDSWELTSTYREKDGGADGYDCISHQSIAKNVLTVGAVNAIPSGYSEPSDVVMSSFSSWGPADDGRIKPDVCGNGVGLYSSTANSNYAYSNYSGTSMAAPNVSGSIGLLLNHWENLTGSDEIRAASMKGLLIHTADEAGTTTGPDYKHGWGLVNTAKAAQVMSDNSEYINDFRIQELTLDDGETIEIKVWKDNNAPIKATICWTDPAHDPQAEKLNDRTPMLINDLDLRLETAAKSHQPWELNPDNPSAAAEKQDNDVDNIEQIEIESPETGLYVVKISHKENLTNGSQDFSLILSGVKSLVPPIAINPADEATDIPTMPEFRWEAQATAENYHLQISETPDFSTIVEDIQNIDGNMKFVSGLKNLHVYYWRVRAENSHGEGPWSEVYEFTTTGNPPTLSYPNNGMIDADFDIQFKWQNLYGDVNYRLQITETGDFSDLVENIPAIDTNVRNVGGFVNLEQYHWRVRAENENGIGQWSSSFSYTTKGVQPELISPANGDEAADIEPAMVWKSIIGNVTYTLQVAADTTFANPLFEFTDISDTNFTIPPLEYFTTYYWRVRAESPEAVGFWSDTWRFRTTPDIPEIVDNPESRGVCLGNDLDLNVVATGRIMQFQWQKDGENITGETKPTLLIDDADFETSAEYRCMITNRPGNDTVYTKNALIYVAINTEITRQPETQYVPEGGTAFIEFKSHVRGFPPDMQPEKIQWYMGTEELENDDKYAGVKSNELSIRNITKQDALEDLWAEVIGFCGDRVETDRINVYIPSVTFTQHPQPVEICEGETAIFTVDAEPSNTNWDLNIQWYQGTDAVENVDGITGAKSKTLTIPDAEEEHAGDYHAEITIEQSSIIFKSDPATFTVNLKPEITKDLDDELILEEDQILDLEIEATGTEPIDYQWYKDGTAVNNATSSSYSTTVTMVDAGDYYCIAANECGEAISNIITVVVNQKDILSASEQSGDLELKNVPNPFNGTSEISFNLEANSNVKLTVTDMLGNEIARLHDGNLSPGRRSFTFNASGHNLTSGVYQYILNIDGKIRTGRMLLIK